MIVRLRITGITHPIGTKAFRRDGADVTAPVLSDGAAVYTPGVSQRRSGATTYDLHDRLGTAARQSDASASLTVTRTYDAFGGLLASTGTPQGPFGFAAASGYQEDGDSGLKLLGHRYYDPSTGRFLTRDPAQDGRNWYAYCDNGPLRWIDPEGKQKRNPHPRKPSSGITVTGPIIINPKAPRIKWDPGWHVVTINGVPIAFPPGWTMGTDQYGNVIICPPGTPGPKLPWPKPRFVPKQPRIINTSA